MHCALHSQHLHVYPNCCNDMRIWDWEMLQNAFLLLPPFSIAHLINEFCGGHFTREDNMEAASR